MSNHTAEHIENVTRQHAEVVRGHDAVHPDRGACGGVGNCALMRAEVDAEREVIDRLVIAARRGVRFTVRAGGDEEKAT